MIKKDNTGRKNNGGRVQQRKSGSKAVLMAVLIIIVAGIVLSAHWTSLSARAFSLDDTQYLSNNLLVQHPGWPSASRFLTEILKPSTVEGYYQPLAMISLMLDYSFGGRVNNLWVFHCTSLVLHIMNTVLIIIFLYILFGQPWVAAAAGLLFGVHPMTVEAIPWISERKTLLAAFFALLSLILYVLYTRKSDRRFLWVSLAMYVLALVSKPTSIPLPLLMLLLDYWPIKRLSWKTVFEKVPFFVLCAVSSVITYLSQKYAGGVALPEDNSPAHVPLILCHNIIFYLYKIIWPVNLTSHYPVPEPLALSHPAVLAGVIGTFLLIPALLVTLRWTRAIFTGWLIFFMAIFPTMGVVGFTFVIASDKYAYLPAVGLLMTLAWLLCRLWDKIYRIHRFVPGLAALAVIILMLSVFEAAATRNYLAYWQDSELLYRHMLSLAPGSYILHDNLGIILCDRGKFDEAVTEYKESIRINPHDAKAYNNYGMVLFRQGRYEEAAARFKEAIRLEPADAREYNNLGNTLASMGKLDDAILQYKMVIRLEPGNSRVYNNLGNVLCSQGKPDEAVSQYKESIRLNPDEPQAHINLGNALAKLERFDEAVKEYQEALLIDPNLTDARNEMERFLKKQ